MMRFFVILASVLCIANADTSKWTDFRVKYSPLPTGVGQDSFWEVPQNKDAALAAGWMPVETTTLPGTTPLCYSEKDLRVCPLYDDMGTIAGMQLGTPVTDVEGHDIPYDFSKHPVFERRTINGEMYWTSIYYLTDPDVVSSGGRPADSTIGSGLWLRSGDSFTQVPTALADIKANTKYTWQNCIPNMGIHYYHDMRPDLKCEDTEPYFLLVKDDNIVGLGWQFFGKTQFVDRNWYDSINSKAVQVTVPLGPPCLSQGADTYGAISIHMYFVDKPWTIPCTQKVDSVVPIPGLP